MTIIKVNDNNKTKIFKSNTLLRYLIPFFLLKSFSIVFGNLFSIFYFISIANLDALTNQKDVKATVGIKYVVDINLVTREIQYICS